MKISIKILVLFFVFASMDLFSQAIERPRPPEWDKLVYGARFIDRFLPMPAGTLSYDTWGTQCVIPRYIDNGIEDRQWSYWGGNILYEDGKYHLFVCGWLENSPRGTVEIPALNPYEKTQVTISSGNIYERDKEYKFVTTIQLERQKPSTLILNAKPISE